MIFNNITLMVLANEREGGPQGTTLLRIKTGEKKLKLTVNQELDMYSITPHSEEKTLVLTATLGKLLRNGNVEWMNGIKLGFIIPSDRKKLILGRYHYLSTTIIDKISLIFNGDGEYVLRGEYQIDNSKRTTWDYFKVVEEKEPNLKLI